MTKPDVLVTWPRNCDYPLWRQWIKDNRFRFNRVIVVFMETNQGDDYRDFLRQILPEDNVVVLDSPAPQSGEDWRNVAICEGLKHSSAEWVWFTEQDFFVLTEQFWDEVHKAVDQIKVEAVGVLQGARVHPCSLFVKREIINRTRFNFGIEPNKSDHFGMFTEDLANMLVPTAIVANDPEQPSYHHYNGLSHNWSLASQNETPNHELDRFLDYLLQCLNTNVTRNKRFEQVANSTLQRLLPHYSRNIPSSPPPQNSGTLQAKN